MDNKSATTGEASPAVIKATTHLEEVNRETKDDVEKHKTTDMSEKKISDVIEILQGLVGRVQKMEEKMDSRFQQMEEKVDSRLQQLEGKVDLLISSIKAEADNMSVDGSFTDDEEPAKEKSEADTNTNTPKEEVAANPFKPRFKPFFAEKESDSRVKPFTFSNSGGVPSLFVGGPFSGGRCGGQGFCSFC